jgi:CBS domain-containing protein
MSPWPESVRARAVAREAAVRMRAFDLGFLPVLANGALAGVLTDRDLLVRGIAEGLPLQRTAVEDLMTARWIGVPPEEPVDAVLRILEAARIRRLPVTDAQGRLVGVAGLADLLRAGPGGKVLDCVASLAAPDRAESIVMLPRGSA